MLVSSVGAPAWRFRLEACGGRPARSSAPLRQPGGASVIGAGSSRAEALDQAAQAAAAITAPTPAIWLALSRSPRSSAPDVTPNAGSRLVNTAKVRAGSRGSA